MFTVGRMRWHGLRSSVALSLVLACSGACGQQVSNKPGDQVAKRNEAVKKINPDLPSAHYFLSSGDVEKFQTGRAKLDILKDINWKGNFQMAGPYRHGSACAISYDLFSQGPASEGGEVVFAIFVDDKFVKWFPTVNTMSIQIGNVNWLVSAVEKEGVNIADLEKEFKARPPVPDQVDGGLTAAYLLLRALGKAPGPEGIENYERNAKLRDKFNAARLKIGMSELEVNAVLKAKPLITGQVEAGTVNVYGSNESVAVSILIPYSNVLVLFKDGKVNAIYAIEGGPDWLAEAKKQFVDFPK